MQLAKQSSLKHDVDLGSEDSQSKHQRFPLAIAFCQLSIGKKFFDILEKVVRRVSNNFIDHIIFRTHHFWLV